MRVCSPTPQEAVGAALQAAKHEMASYHPPRLLDPLPSLGGCGAGWVTRELAGGWVLVCYRPEGDAGYAAQRAQLELYQATVFTAPEYETMWNRRQWPGIAALLVRRVTP